MVVKHHMSQQQQFIQLHTKFTCNKFTYFKPMRSCNRYDLITGTVSSPRSENGVKDFVDVLLMNMHSNK